MYLMRFLDVTAYMYQDTSGHMYLGLFIKRYIKIHRDTKSRVRYIKIHFRYIKIHLLICICHFGYHRKCILPSYSDPTAV